MAGTKEDVIEAGKWLARERAQRGERCSGTFVAALATALARKQGDPIIIRQQQLSDIENATLDRGPKKLPAWWRYVRALVDGGDLDDTLDASKKGAERPPADAESMGQVFTIHAPGGEVVGQIVWEKPLR
jgi:hypothetical protein